MLPFSYDLLGDDGEFGQRTFPSSVQQNWNVPPQAVEYIRASNVAMLASEGGYVGLFFSVDGVDSLVGHCFSERELVRLISDLQQMLHASREVRAEQETFQSHTLTHQDILTMWQNLLASQPQQNEDDKEEKA